MSKKLLALLLAMLLACTLLAGCTSEQVVWESYEEGGSTGEDGGEDGGEVEKIETVVTDKDGKTSIIKVTRTKAKKTTKGTGKTTTKKSVGTKKPGEVLSYDAIPDAGANYAVKGNISIAVDTARFADYDAMFDVMKKLYPNVKISFDRWQHTNLDTAMEYLTTRMRTGDAADIIWDESGKLPYYIAQKWIRPITKYVNADPEAKNIPANVRESMTFGGELWAVPHQATFSTVAFNDKLMTQLNAKYPALNWSWADMCALLEKGASGLDKGISVGSEDVYFVTERYTQWAAAAKGKHGVKSLNSVDLKTNSIDVQDIRDKATELLRLRNIAGVEGWKTSTQKDSSGQSVMSVKFGLTSYKNFWSSGKSLMEVDGTWKEQQWDQNKNLKYVVWPSPNVNGDLPVHIDHCFITSACSDDKMDTAYQLLRFMTFTTNGNLARLTMYDKEGIEKYNLNAHIFYPVTTNQTVINKFNALERTNKTDEYMLKNIPNSTRFDTRKFMPDVDENYSDAKISAAYNKMTDGSAGMSEADEEIADFNKRMADSVAKSQKDIAAAVAYWKNKK